MKFPLIALFLTLVFSFTASAVELKICVITSDIDNEVTELFLDVNEDGQIESLRFYKTDSGEVISNEVYPAEVIIEEGIVAVKSDDGEYDVIILEVEEFSPTEGGIVKLNYLLNGIRGARRNYRLKLLKIDNRFLLTTIAGKEINHLAVRANRLPIIGHLVGVKEIKPTFISIEKNL